MHVQQDRSLDNCVPMNKSSDSCVQQDTGLDSCLFNRAEVYTAMCSTG